MPAASSWALMAAFCSSSVGCLSLGLFLCARVHMALRHEDGIEDAKALGAKLCLALHGNGVRFVPNGVLGGFVLHHACS